MLLLLLVIWIAAVKIYPSVAYVDIILSENVPDSLNDPVLEELRPYFVSPISFVKGQEASIEDYPHQVSISVRNSHIYCGASIISVNRILAAAHCVGGVDLRTVVVRAGSSWGHNGTVIPIAVVMPHPMYNQSAFDNDVAVMKTVDPIKFDKTMQPIPLPPLNRRLAGGTHIDVSGWGRTQQDASSIPERLMAVQIPVVDWVQCFLVYSSVLTKNEFCAGNFFRGGQGTCQGDSGGGVATQDGMAVGIVSYGRGCGQPLSPSVFADIAAPTIRNFITEHTGL